MQSGPQQRAKPHLQRPLSELRFGSAHVSSTLLNPSLLLQINENRCKTALVMMDDYTHGRGKLLAILTIPQGQYAETTYTWLILQVIWDCAAILGTSKGMLQVPTGCHVG